MQAEPSGRLNLLIERARLAASLIGGQPAGEIVKVVSHIDADGISSAALLAWLLLRLGLGFHISFVKKLTPEYVKSLLSEDYRLYLFSDLGSGYREELGPLAERSPLILVDHHEPLGGISGRMVDLNPHEVGVDGGREVSAAGVALALYSAILRDEHPPLHLALVGAIGDVQARDGFTGVNSEILSYAERIGLVKSRVELRLFGGPEYPLLLSLERTVDPPIPGVSGSSSGALELLQSLGIPPRVDDKWTTLSDLDDEERSALLSEIVKRLAIFGHKVSPQQLLGTSFTLLTEPPGSPLRDLGTFATVLNACGRMGRPDLGLMLGLGRRGRIMEMVNETISQYRRELARFLESSRDLQRVVGSVLFVDGRGSLRDTLTSPVASILARSRPDEDVRVVAVMTEDSEAEGCVKVSLRLTQAGIYEGVDLAKIAVQASVELGGVGGGHSSAAGLTLPAERWEEFVKILSASV